MNTYPDLYDLASELDSIWSEKESVDWQEAEDLVAQIRQMAPDDLGELQAILDYADANDDWDSGEVASWPERIVLGLDSSGKDYQYRPAGDEWEVVGVYMSGREDWVGTVDTETLAQLLASSLNSPRHGMTMTLKASVEWAESRIEMHSPHVRSKNDSILIAANYAEQCLEETGMHLHRMGVEMALRERAGLN